MNAKTVDKADLEDIFIYRQQQEKESWIKRGAVKTVEIVCYIGVFLSSSSFWYIVFVVSTAIAMMLDFLFQYEEWYQLSQFQKAFF